MPADTNGWPDASKPGVPMNPERDGWHWLVGDDGQPRPKRWTFYASEVAEFSRWEWREGSGACFSAEYIGKFYRYLGPCLTPAEVTARERAAYAAGWMAAREAGGKVAKDTRVPFMEIDREKYAIGVEIAVRIRALPPPEDAAAALAEVVRRAKEEEREACFLAAHRVPFPAVTERHETAFDACGELAENIATAIRARGGE